MNTTGTNKLTEFLTLTKNRITLNMDYQYLNKTEQLWTLIALSHLIIYTISK